MFYDIVLPKGNEKEFAAMAEKLGIEGLCFLYELPDMKEIEKRKKSTEEMQQSTKIKLAAAYKTEGTRTYKVHDLGETAITQAAQNSRETIAKHKPDIVYGLEQAEEKDYAKSRNSGMDKPTCQFAAQNNVAVAISFSNILNTERLPQLIGRIQQNLRLCRKYKINTAIASFAKNPYEMRSPHELKSFLLAIGAHTSQAKQATETVSQILERKTT